MSITPQPAVARPASPPAGVGDDDLRVVLFGLANAGKSSLLGALGEAALAQEHLLGGRLLDESGGLATLARTLYDEHGLRTAEEVVPYPIRYEPPEGGAAVDAVLMDCDGRIANDLLQQKHVVDGSERKGTLAAEVADADALLLVVDAAATAAVMEADFAEFDRFLRMIEETRGERTEVAGLPVFLVLTKCDLLAHKEDSTADWMDRIEQRKRDVDTRFREFLSRRLGPEGEAGPVLGFGRIDLHVWATAVKKPGLHGAAARPREPYGVAELFRQCLLEAGTHRRREERSERKLAWLVGAAAVLLLSLGGLTALFLTVNQTTAAAGLAQRIDDVKYLDKETPAERLRGSLEELRRREKRLQDYQKDPGFGSLKPDLREWVNSRQKELSEYAAYLEKLLGERSPAKERSKEALKEQIDRLKGPLAVPEKEWELTPAGARHKDLAETAEAIAEGVQKAQNWYEDDSEKIARESLTERDAAARVKWAEWAGQVEELLGPDRRPPFRPSDALPGAAGLTYETVVRFDRVVAARAAWEADRERLRRLLDVACALGLAPATPERPAVLFFGRELTLLQAKERLGQLEKAYPNYRKTFAREGLPMPALASTVRSRYESLLVSGQNEVLRQLKASGAGREETPRRWDGVRAWLKEPTELAAWRQLAVLLLRMEEPLADDPVPALTSFLNREAFDLNVESVVVEIPFNEKIAPRAEASLDVFLSSSAKKPALSFRQSGKERRDEERQVTVYTFRDGGQLRYRPGDELWAVLPLSGGTRLVWSDSRSGLYQFERLRRPPLSQDDKAAIGAGRERPGVRLLVRPVDGVPDVPDLMPRVKLD